MFGRESDPPVSLATFLMHFIAFSWWFTPGAPQYLATFLRVSAGTSLPKKLFRTQGGNLFCNR